MKSETARLLVGRTEAARLCGLAISTWERYLVCGWVPAPIIIGTARRWRMDQLKQWIESGCPRPNDATK
jgi:predicted DNA-binding transcriptional regulator AlpA